ncbi:MAG: TadE/TadG family type IV pilus assembly protein [Acidimicrobiales bacterium]
MAESRRGRPGRTERGASAVEFALVGPLFFLLLAAIIDLSVGLFTLDGASSAAAEAARVGSIARNSPDADAQILDTFTARSSLGVGLTTHRVVVYQASGSDAGPPAECLAGRQRDGCNVYEGATLTHPMSLCSGAGGSTGGWCPALRADGHLLGVWFSVEYDGLTGVLPLHWTRHAYAVAEIEPAPVRAPGSGGSP